MTYQRNKTILLVNPHSGVNCDIPNMSLAYIATSLGAEVVDLNTKREPIDRFLKNKADTLGISVQTRNYSEAKDIAQKYMGQYKEAQIRSVTGFVDVQCCYPYVDFNEAIKIDGEFSDSLPFPDYSLFDSFEVFKKNWSSGKWNYPLLSSLGCPFQCTYCASRNRKVHSRSVDNCIKELIRARDLYNIRSFVILDDCFNYSNQRVLDFCTKVKSLKLSYICANGLRCDIFDDQIASALKGSGCKMISFGIESTDPQVLLNIKKGESISQIEQAVITAKKYFNEVNGYFIIGLPGSSYEKDLNSLNFAKRLGINAFFSYYVPQDQRQDTVFYGENAKPLSDSYPKELQKKIYDMTRHMRPFSIKDTISVFIKRLIDIIKK